MNGGPSLPVGAPIALFVEGILDGRVADAGALESATAALGGTGAGPFRCEIAGGRFTVIPERTQAPGSGFDEAAQARFLEAMRAVVAAAAPDSVESNLRCRMVYAADVVETLFVVRRGEVEAVSRVRPRTPADDELLAPAALVTGLANVRRRELVFAAAALLLVGLVAAWWSGWIDRVLAARAESLRIDTGPFGAMLAVGVERSLGNYRVELRRGPEYPATPEALAERREGSDSLTGRAACAVVGDGGALFVQSLDEQGEVLDQVRVELRPLLGDAAATVPAKLPGRIRATQLRLSLSADTGGR